MTLAEMPARERTAVGDRAVPPAWTFCSVMTSILVGFGAFMLILIFACAYLDVVEWLLGPAEDPRAVFAAGLVLGFLLAKRALDRLCRWFGAGT
jgi:hypothetical protein